MKYLNQRIPTRRKNKEWRKKIMDYYCNIADEWYGDWERMVNNYALKNNQLNREDYRALCRGLGSEKHGAMFVNAYNKTHTIIEALKGEEWNRPFSFDIVNNSKRIINRIERDKRREIEMLIEEVFKIEVAKYQEMFQAEAQAAQQGDPQQAEKQKAKIMERYEKLYKNLNSPKEIYDKYDNITVAEEVTMSYIMKMLVSRLNIKFTKNSTFEDALIAGVEAVEVFIEREGDLPKLKQVNPIYLFYEKSPDVQWIQDGDYAGYVETMTVERVIEKFGHLLSKEDLGKLDAFNDASYIKGLDFKLHHNRDAPSQWRDNNQKSRFSNGRRYTEQDLKMLDDKYGGDKYGNINSVISSRLGLSSSETGSYYTDDCDVYTVYWKSQRRIGKYTFTNEYGEIEETFVDENFVIPKEHSKATYKTSPFTPTKTKYLWEQEGVNYEFEWIWIPEVWKGVRIGWDIYVDVGPVQHAYQSLLNPYEVKLPIYGYIYNSRNAFTVTTMDRMAPWQKVYYSVMAKFLKLLTQDRGVLTFLNVHLLDKDLGLEKTLQIAEDQGFIPYNPLSNSKGAGGIHLTNTMKVAEKIDATNSNVIQHYINILQFLENNIKLAAGMSDQRLAQTAPRTTATDNYRDTMHSVNMTESLHAAHDLLWQEILQGLMEMTVSVLDQSTGKLRGFLDDDHKTIIDMGMVQLEDNYRLRIADNSKAYRILEQVKQLAHALMQNDKVGLNTLIDLLETENLSEFKTMAKEAEEAYMARMEEQQASQQQHEKEMAQAQRDAQEDLQKGKLDEIYLKEYMTYLREKMKSEYEAASFDAEKDYNKDGIADYLQLEELRAKIALDAKNIDIKEFEVAMKERNAILEQQNKDREFAQKEQELLEKRMDSDKERQNKKAIEMMKSRNKN